MSFVLRHLKRLTFAIKGIGYALMTDFSYRSQVYGGLLVLMVFCLLVWPLSHTETLFLALAWVLILITELQNSSFEAALDRLHPKQHDAIGRSKDMAAGAVLTAGFFLVFVMAMILAERLL